MFWNTWTSFILKVKPWHQFHKIMKPWREKVKPWDQFHKSSCRPFFLSVTEKMKPMKPILHKLWNHEEKKWNHETSFTKARVGLFFVCNGKNETNETNFAQIMKPWREKVKPWKQFGHEIYWPVLCNTVRFQ